MSEANVHGEFYKESVLMGAASVEAGRPIYSEQDFVRIKVVGSRDVVERKATNLDKERFAEQWERFSKGEEQKQQGQRLGLWPALTHSQVKNLEGMGVHTVEALADCSDTAIQKMGMGMTKLREDARAWLSRGTEASELKKLADEQAKIIDAQGAQLADMQRQMAEMQEQMRAMNTPAEAPPAQPPAANGTIKLKPKVQ